MVALHAMPRFVNFGLQTPEIHATVYCSQKVIGSNMLYFHSQGGSTVGNMVIVKRTTVFDFLSHVTMLTRDIDIVNMSVRP